MDDMNIKSAIEAILFAAGEPVPAARISLILGVSEDEVYAAAKELSDEYSFNLRGIRLLKLDKNIQLCSSFAAGAGTSRCRCVFPACDEGVYRPGTRR